MLRTLVLLSGLLAAASLQAAPLRGGEHGAFTRLTLPLANGEWISTREGRRVTIALPEGTRPDLARAFARIDRTRIAAISVDGDRLSVELACDCEVSTVLSSTELLVMDVSDPDPGAASPPRTVLLPAATSIAVEGLPPLDPKDGIADAVAKAADAGVLVASAPLGQVETGTTLSPHVALLRDFLATGGEGKAAPDDCEAFDDLRVASAALPLRTADVFDPSGAVDPDKGLAQVSRLVAAAFVEEARAAISILPPDAEPGRLQTLLWALDVMEGRPADPSLSRRAATCGETLALWAAAAGEAPSEPFPLASARLPDALLRLLLARTFERTNAGEIPVFAAAAGRELRRRAPADPLAALLAIRLGERPEAEALAILRASVRAGDEASGQAADLLLDISDAPGIDAVFDLYKADRRFAATPGLRTRLIYHLLEQDSFDRAALLLVPGDAAWAGFARALLQIDEDGAFMEVLGRHSGRLDRSVLDRETRIALDARIDATGWRPAPVRPLDYDLARGAFAATGPAAPDIAAISLRIEAARAALGRDE